MRERACAPERKNDDRQMHDRRNDGSSRNKADGGQNLIHAVTHQANSAGGSAEGETVPGLLMTHDAVQGRLAGGRRPWTHGPTALGSCWLSSGLLSGCSVLLLAVWMGTGVDQGPAPKQQHSTAPHSNPPTAPAPVTRTCMEPTPLKTPPGE